MFVNKYFIKMGAYISKSKRFNVKPYYFYVRTKILLNFHIYIGVPLTILGVMEILYSFTSVLEARIGKEVPVSSRIEFLEKFLPNKFALSDAEENISGPLNRRYSRFTFVENIISNSPKVPRVKFLGSDELFRFSSICKFGSFKNHFAPITSLSELYFRFRRFVLLVKTKKWLL